MNIPLQITDYATQALKTEAEGIQKIRWQQECAPSNLARVRFYKKLKMIWGQFWPRVAF